jgi:hypothetical protein
VSSDSLVSFMRENGVLIGSAGFAVWLFFFRRRTATLVHARQVTSGEVSVAFWGGLSVISGSGLLMWLLQRYVGREAALCLLSSRPRAPTQWAAWLLLLVVYAVIFWWVYARGGDDILTRLEPAFSGPGRRRIIFSPARVRLAVLALCVAAPTVNLVSTASKHPWCDEPSNQRLERP